MRGRLRRAGVIAIALWFALTPFVALVSAAKGPWIAFSMPSGAELTADMNGDRSTAYALAASRASARALACWHAPGIAVYYFASSLRGVGFASGGLGIGPASYWYFYGGILSFLLSIVCAVGLLLRRT
jgi:hypothetical protein